MAIEELSPDQEGRRLHVIALSAGWNAEFLRELLGYKKVSSVYRLFNGEQRLTLPQMKKIARAAAGTGEWRSAGWTELFYYLQGGKRLGFQDSPEGDGGSKLTDGEEAMGGQLRPVTELPSLRSVA